MVFSNDPKCIPLCTSLHVYSLNFVKKLRNAALSQMQGNRGGHLLRDQPQVLVRAICGL